MKYFMIEIKVCYVQGNESSFDFKYERIIVRYTVYESNKPCLFLFSASFYVSGM